MSRLGRSLALAACLTLTLLAPPASAHSVNDDSVCGSGYRWLRIEFEALPVSSSSDGVLMVARNANDVYCSVLFATGDDHGVAHPMQVRTHGGGQSYDGNDIDTGSYAHYAGPVYEQRVPGYCVWVDAAWTDAQTGVRYRNPYDSYC